MKHKTLRILISLAVLTLVFTLLPIRGEEKIYSSVIRLHVIASSNSDTDQRMKLFVRDRLLSESRENLMPNGKTASEAFESLKGDGLSDILEAARLAVSDFCREEGISMPGVKVIAEKERYPMKKYEALCFPSGEYYSLRVIIGNGEGENWWCVLFPPLCFSAASGGESREEEFISVGLTPDEYNVISKEESPKYRVRFKILEWVESLFSSK